MIDFRSLRDSGITWRFLKGERGEVIQREAGHEEITTTLGYAKEVQDRQGRYGDPFPALPDDLTGPSPPGSPRGPVTSPVTSKPNLLETCVELVGEAGFEPAISSTQSLRTTGLCYSPRSRDFLPRPGALAHRSRALRFRP